MAIRFKCTVLKLVNCLHELCDYICLFLFHSLSTLFSDNCRIGKKRKTENSELMVTMEQCMKLTKTQGKDKVIYNLKYGK